MLVSEIPFDPEKGLEGLEMLRKSAVDLKYLRTSGIRFSVARRDACGKVYLQTLTKEPCHGRLQGNGRFDMCATGIDYEVLPSAYDYFVKGSPFGRFVLNRDTYAEDGFIAITGDLWYPFQNCLNIFCRSTGDNFGSSMEASFKDFISRGVPPLVALLVVTSTTMFRDHLPDTMNVGFRSSHSLVSYLSVDGLRNFFSENAVAYQHNSDNRPTVNPTNYNGGVYVWEKTGACAKEGLNWLSVAFAAREAEIMKNRGVKRSLSPFDTKSASNTRYFRRNEFNDHALPFLLDVYYSVNKDRIPAERSSFPTPSRPAGETVCQTSVGVVDAVQEHGNAFARAVGVRN